MRTKPLQRKSATPLEWAILNFGDTYTDRRIADEMHSTIEEVKKVRKSLGKELPAGTTSLKDYARKFLTEMPEIEKKEFLARLDPDLVWQMGEGKAATTGELTISQEPIKIDISHQLIKVYGPSAGRILDHVADDGEERRLSAGTGK